MIRLVGISLFAVAVAAAQTAPAKVQPAAIASSSHPRCRNCTVHFRSLFLSAKASVCASRELPVLFEWVGIARWDFWVPRGLYEL